MPAKRIIYLIGFMGCGKTTAGRKLAAGLGFGFLDLDQKIEEENKMPVSDIFAQYGEEHFRKLESEALRKLDPAAGIVVAAGGGAPCYMDNIEFMRSTGIVVYLAMDPVSLKKRLEGGGQKRPLVKGLSGRSLQEFIEKKLAERSPFYNRAHIVADGTNPDISGLVSRVLTWQDS